MRVLLSVRAAGLPVMLWLAAASARGQGHRHMLPEWIWGPPAPARIDGDVYLVTAEGDVKPAAGIVVRLLPAASEVAIARRLAENCDDEARALRRWDQRQDSVAHMLGGKTFSEKAQSMRELTESLLATTKSAGAVKDRVLLAAVTDSAPTGMHAHYTFAQIKPGSYFLWAETKISEQRYIWWKLVRVASGQALQEDLDNTALIWGGPWDCPPNLRP